MSDLTPHERRITKEFKGDNPDLPGLMIFFDGQWIAQCDKPGGTGLGSTPKAAVSDLRKEVYRRKHG